MIYKQTKKKKKHKIIDALALTIEHPKYHEKQAKTPLLI